MKKVYKMQELECANCAAKMEEAIRRIPGVETVTISFMTQRMTIETDEEQHDRIMKEAAKCCRKFEPDCRIVL
ncbi:MAG: heavy-metal-associated domain-containing protein [Clostridia bacterium]|nr:heavy-metal-associated domain-containing protein [Clostridia bacterium]